MVDRLSPTARSALMSRIRSKNTKPELVVRRRLHALGYRFFVHAKRLPGSPDLVFPRRRKAIFVHGCFWHSHDCRHGERRPGTNVEYWGEKTRANRERDERKESELRDGGWEVATIWECETKSKGEEWLARCMAFLGPPGGRCNRVKSGGPSTSGPERRAGTGSRQDWPGDGGSAKESSEPVRAVPSSSSVTARRDPTTRRKA